jgi:DNA-binding NtrC family response regulator
LEKKIDMKKKVLIVDDDVAIRESLKKVLLDAGYDVVLAAGGTEAALRFDVEEIDLLLLDLNLPNQSGWDVFEHVTTRRPWVPVIIITGMPHQFRTALAAGAGALFEKPVEVPELLKTMEELLAEPNEQRLRRLCGHLTNTRYEPAGRAPGGQRNDEKKPTNE